MRCAGAEAVKVLLSVSASTRLRYFAFENHADGSDEWECEAPIITASADSEKRS
jgi:hypothetical protein